MRWLNFLRVRSGGRPDRTAAPRRKPTFAPAVEGLETRELLTATVGLSGGILTVMGGTGPESIGVALDPTGTRIVVVDNGRIIEQAPSASVSQLILAAGSGDTNLAVAPSVTQAALLIGGPGNDILQAGGGPTQLVGGSGNTLLVSGAAPDALYGGTGLNLFVNVKPTDQVFAHPSDLIFAAPPPAPPAAPTSSPQLNQGQVSTLLDRAAAATASDDGIVVIVDRNGTPLGVRVEGNVSTAITSDPHKLVFAIDGALAEARTAAFFASNGAPLTSRTIQYISQTTITQRMVQSDPSITVSAATPLQPNALATDPTSTVAGPGFVAPIGIHGHFPPNVLYTPQVDLFQIEGTNRDISENQVPGAGRFNVDPQYIPPGKNLVIPDSYGVFSGLEPTARPRGIGTLPGGVPIYFDGNLVGGIGVFFPGQTGYADEENSALSSNYNPQKLDRAMEAEYVAFEAVGGAPGINLGVGAIAGIPALPGVILPITRDSQRIDLVGLTLDILGPGGTQGPGRLVQFGSVLGRGNPASGTNMQVDPQGDQFLPSQPVPDGYLVQPHNGTGLTAQDVNQIVTQGTKQAQLTRAAIRLPLGSRTRMVIAVSNMNGNILGLYRMQDATIFSIDVAVAKARNVAYYANPAELQPQDQLPGVPAGTALTNRTFRYLALPHFPEGIDYQPPGPFSVLRDGGTNPLNALNIGAPLPAGVFQTVQGHDAFNPSTNFHDPFNKQNQDGIVFFPGSVPLYKTINGQSVLVGGLGVSGDGVDQDDVVTASAALGFTNKPVPRSDQVYYAGLHLPYQKFLRNPEG